MSLLGKETPKTDCRRAAKVPNRVGSRSHERDGRLPRPLRRRRRRSSSRSAAGQRWCRLCQDSQLLRGEQRGFHRAAGTSSIAHGLDCVRGAHAGTRVSAAAEHAHARARFRAALAATRRAPCTRRTCPRATTKKKGPRFNRPRALRQCYETGDRDARPIVCFVELSGRPAPLRAHVPCRGGRGAATVLPPAASPNPGKCPALIRFGKKKEQPHVHGLARRRLRRWPFNCLAAHMRRRDARAAADLPGPGDAAADLVPVQGAAPRRQVHHRRRPVQGRRHHGAGIRRLCLGE